MKSHTLAKALQSLARVLLAMPDAEVDDLPNLLSKSQKQPSSQSDDQIAVNLNTLVNLSKIDKARWKDFIDRNSLPIEVKTTYSVRDLLGKILNYLEKNPQEMERIRQNVRRKSGSSTSELDRAFEIFLSDDYK